MRTPLAGAAGVWFRPVLMCRALLPLFFAVFLTAGVVRGQSPTPSAEPAPSAGEVEPALSAQLWLVGDRRFFAAWKNGRREPPAALPVPAPSPVFIVVVLSGAARDERGSSQVGCDFTVRRPDGSIYATRSDAVLVAPGPSAPPPPPGLQLGRDSLAIYPEASDPPGQYTVEALVRDRVSGASVPLRASLLLK